MEESRSTTLMGIKFTGVTEAECVSHVASAWKKGQGGWLHTVNVDILRRLVKEAPFREMCQGVDVTVADGMPLVWASRVKGIPLPERVTGSSLIYSLSEEAAQSGKSIFLMGGNEGVAEKAAEELTKLYPNLEIAGCHFPEMGFEKNRESVVKAIEAIKVAQPDLVFVALSVPKAEWFIEQVKPYLPSTWFVGVGISFSFVSEEQTRAPLWMQKRGLEWLYRFYQEPFRLFRRYFLEDIPFAMRLLVHSALDRGRRDDLS